MFAVIETATGIVMDLFEAMPEITEAGMISPVRAHDIRATTHSVVEAEAPAERFLPGLMTLSGGVWAIPDLEAYEAVMAELTPPVLLPNLTMRQFRLGLLSAGLLAGVDAAIDGLDEPERSAARIEFEYAGEVVRTDPWVTTLAAVMGLSAAEIDALWAWAAGL